MMRALFALVVLCGLSLSSVAHADEAGPRNALSLHPLSLGAHGLAVQYERYLLPRHLSLALGLGFRSSSRGDYSSWVTSTGIEPRFWLMRKRGRFGRLGDDAMIGPYVGLRTDVSWLLISDTRRDAWVGGSVGLLFVGSFGYRFTIGRVEITPAAGVGTRTDFDVAGRLAPWTRAVLRLDTTVGWLF